MANINNKQNSYATKEGETLQQWQIGGIENAGKVVKVDNDGIIKLMVAGGGSSVSIIEKTYVELKTMRDGGTLVAGQLYRITDYVATTTQTNTQSANHPFDIIVLAIANNKLSEEARAIQHSGDTYFATSELSAWEVWYCLDNDTGRFAWANSSGKGVVYHLIDEFQNDIWYDFKGIQVKNNKGSTDRFYYLFDFEGADSSLSATTTYPTVHTNKLGVYIESNKYRIGCNVFKGKVIWNNTFGNACYNITTGETFTGNTIESYFHHNSIGSNFTGNTIGNSFYNNTIGNQFSYNAVGNNFSNNNIGVNFKYNTIGTYFSDNDTTSQTSQPQYCSFSSGVNAKITTSTTLARLTDTTYYIGSDNSLKTLD